MIGLRLDKEALRRGLIAAAFPLVCIAVSLVLMVVWRILSLPSAVEVFAWLTTLYERHGLVVVALAALIEGLVVINVYVPGSAVVLVAIVASRGNALLATSIVATASAAFLLTAQINYAIGYFGLHSLISRLGGKRWLESAGASYRAHGALVLIPSYVHPSVGSFMSVTCGMFRLKWWRFVALSAIAILLWNSLWGMLTYFLADSMHYVATNPRAVIIALGAWAVGAGTYGFVRSRRESDVKP